MAESTSFIDMLLGAQIQSNGVHKIPRRWLNFSSAFTITDDEANDRITVSGGGGGGFTAGGDLAGSSSSQQVLSVTGTAGIVAMHGGATGTTLKGDDFTTNGGTAPTTTIQAPNATGTGSTIGSTLDLKSGTGNTPGAINLKIGNTLRLNISPTGTLTLSAYSTAGVLSVNGSGTVSTVLGGADGLVLVNNATPAPVWSSYAKLTSAGLRVGSTVTATATLDVTGNAKIGVNTAKVQIDSYGAAPTTHGAIWMGAGVPAVGNVAVASDGTSTSINGSTRVYIDANAAVNATFTASGLRLGDATDPTERLEVIGKVQAGSGTAKTWIGSLISSETTHGAVWLGNLTPSATNYQLIANTTDTALNAISGSIFLRRANATIATLDSTGLRIGDATAPTAKLDVQGNSSLVGNATIGTTASAHIINGSQRWQVRAVAANLVIDTTTTDTVILVDTSAARAITLPAATTGRVLKIKDKTGQAGTNNITITRAAAESIEGVAANYVMATNWGCLTLVCDGTNWFIC